MRAWLVFGVLMLFCTCVPAQNLPEGGELLQLERLSHERRALYTLGGWALGNIALGLALRARTDGVDRRFHEMNAIWNVVNLGIAGFGLYSALREPLVADVLTAFGSDLKFQKVLLFNAGLDVGYLLGGLYLTERSRREGVDRDQLLGYGRAVMLQGGFLLVFDLINYFIANGRTDGYHAVLALVGDGLGLLLSF